MLKGELTILLSENIERFSNSVRYFCHYEKNKCTTKHLAKVRPSLK